MSDRRKFVEHHEEEEGEPWLISYADMMTLLFGFFVILFSMAEVDSEKLAQFGESVASTLVKGDTKRALLDTNDKDSAEAKIKAMNMYLRNLGVGGVDDVLLSLEAKQVDKKLLKNAKKNLGDNEIVEKIKSGSDDAEKSRYAELIIPTQHLFAPASSQLLPEARQKLQLLAQKINELAEVGEVRIVAHSGFAVKDNAQSSPWQNSMQRASVVADALAANGLARRRMSVEGRGNREPLAPLAAKNGRLLEENQRRSERLHIILQRR